MASKKLKRWLKVAIQIVIAAFAIRYVVRTIDLDELKVTLLSANFGWLFLAFLAFNASKALSALRLNYFFRALGIQLKERFNLKLYYLGMLYNQFLPGGIGGDGYKVYLLNKWYKTSVKSLISATLLDRVSGVVALGFLAFILGLIGHGQEAIAPFGWLLWVGLVVAYPSYYLLVHLLFKTFKSVNHITNLQALGVQSLQVISAFLILKSLGVELGYIDYLTLFLVTSVAATLPVSLPGGIGIRELVMVKGAVFLLIDQTSATALATLFFLISLVSALGGIAYLKLDRPEKAD
ncbi:lysylphosphatidylglycerol synthase transmembrane domain-containing protein [Roseivirga sp.]|uniref:lysylphosphatidylglycerol synthase transmembrane domain-containing protein n=1 Tax=Roseivirga sp. TaxID=1964215 RepID=UPI003B51E7F8